MADEGPKVNWGVLAALGAAAAVGLVLLVFFICTR